MKEFFIILIVLAALYILAGIFFMAYTAMKSNRNIEPKLILTWLWKVC